MHTMAHQVHDLGGSTLENPEGNDIGTAAAALMGKAEEPGTKPASDSKEGMKKLKGHPEDHEGHELVHPEHENGPGVDTAGHEYMHPTGVMKEEEATSEEVIEEEELTEEEVRQALEEKKKWMKHRMEEMGSCKEDIDALFNGEDLSEEFKSKASTIFEAAVINRAIQVVEELEAEILLKSQSKKSRMNLKSKLTHISTIWLKSGSMRIRLQSNLV
jgi:hypothetical protein